MIIKNQNVSKQDTEKTTRGIEALLSRLIKADKSNKIMTNLIFNPKHNVYLSDNIKSLINEVNKNRNKKHYSKRFYKMLKERLSELNIHLLIDEKTNHETLLPIQNNDIYKCKSKLNGKVKVIYHAQGNNIRYHKPESKSYPEYSQYIPYTYDSRYNDCLPMRID